MRIKKFQKASMEPFPIIYIIALAGNSFGVYNQFLWPTILNILSISKKEVE